MAVIVIHFDKLIDEISPGGPYEPGQILTVRLHLRERTVLNPGCPGRFAQWTRNVAGWREAHASGERL